MSIDVASELRSIRIPALLIQPLVENAIKHGIAESIMGGEVRIVIRFRQPAPAGLVPELVICVADTGAGTTNTVIQRRRARGLGLSNVEQRLQRYTRGAGTLTIDSAPGIGTTAEIRIPAELGEAALLGSSSESAVASNRSV